MQSINLYFTPMGIFSFFSKEKKETLDKGLERTKQGVFSKIARAIAGKSKIDDEILDNLEEVFITSDVGVETTLKIIDRIEHRVSRDKYVNSSELNNLLCEEITELLAENNNDSALEDFTVPQDHKPHVIMVVGVNGVGKTTTIGKLAYQFKKAGNKVMLRSGTARHLGRTRRCSGNKAETRSRPCISGIRHSPIGQGQRHRCSDNRHRRTTSQQEGSYGRAHKNQERDAESRSRRTPRSVARA